MKVVKALQQLPDQAATVAKMAQRLWKTVSAFACAPQHRDL
jgi:hypothetical protein